MKKRLGSALLLTTLLLTGCSKTPSQVGYTKKGVKYENYLDGERYDKSIFYRNTDKIQGADPSVITVGDEYYLYVTNAYASGDTSYVQGFKSKNLSDWEHLGNVFVPNRNAWAVHSLWAPEVIEYDDQYYMYYSGYDANKKRMGVGLAVASNPAGPFHEYEGTLKDGTVITHQVTPFDLGFKVIDPSVFIDEDGRIYMYVSKDQVEGKSDIYVVELENDMVSIKEDSLVGPLVEPSQEWENPYGFHRWNEAPFVVKHNNKYYLTYSANYYASSLYAIGYAVSENPTGPFVKASENPILSAKEELVYISGPGHNSMFYSVDKSEMFISYHVHIDVDNGGGERKIAFDRVRFEEGKMQIIGPSFGPQLVPSGSSTYQNINKLATVTSNLGRDTSLLVDGHINFNFADVSTYEYLVDKKETIKFTFSEVQNIVAILVYDSADYFLSGTAYSLTFDKDSVSNVYFDEHYKFLDQFDYEIKMPGTASIIQFESIKSKTVTLAFSPDISISEIIIVGGEK